MSLSQTEDHYHSHSTHVKKKRVGKACDSCRIKKTKCDGKKPCNRCLLDNKICVFTEKKKLKEKNHPTGYIDLLETRLDILSKSFEKLIELSRPYLPEIDQIVSQRHINSDLSSDEEYDQHRDYDVVPINRVVSYLIKQKGLLRNLPMEWEQGAMIAANYDSRKNLQLASKLFANHKFGNNSGETASLPGDSSSLRINTKVKQEPESPCLSRASSTDNLVHSTTNATADDDAAANAAAAAVKATTATATATSSLDSDYGNKYSNDGVLSDLNSDDNQSSISPPYMFGQSSNTAPAASLFAYNSFTSSSKNSSMTSLSNKYENHSLSTAPATTLRRSSSSTCQAGLTNQKVKSNNGCNGHVHKPVHHSRIPSLDTKRRNSCLSSPASSVHNVLLSQPPSAVLMPDDYESVDESTIINNPSTQLHLHFPESSFYINGSGGADVHPQTTTAFDGLSGVCDPFMNNKNPFAERY
ncbi:FCR1 [Candida oxycetoniae]|uniref:FCR1 n=1 Tax=Candida oxycetoniae TaxID=497107 RepID=A0AAI9SU22_9ASCO|nr:FCR1 [Candida oxycetoniae]KAI3402823.2 FCR1 [Candida oxycetoniae]